MKGKGGRPPLDEADRIRAQAWFNAVSLTSGKSDRELEEVFGQRIARGPNQGKLSIGANPGLWRKYKLGLSCPKTKPAKGGRKSIVERVEERFPGTAKWMSMPLWDTIRPKPLEMSDLKELYLSLSPPVRALIVDAQPQPSEKFWRRQVDIETLCQQLLEVGGLDSATAVLALVREAETAQNRGMYLYLLARWAEFCQATLQRQPEFVPLIGKINALIERRFGPISPRAAQNCPET